jgi:hypothetical protein
LLIVAVAGTTYLKLRDKVDEMQINKIANDVNLFILLRLKIIIIILM